MNNSFTLSLMAFSVMVGALQIPLNGYLMARLDPDGRLSKSEMNTLFAETNSLFVLAWNLIWFVMLIMSSVAWWLMAGIVGIILGVAAYAVGFSVLMAIPFTRWSSPLYRKLVVRCLRRKQLRCDADQKQRIEDLLQSLDATDPPTSEKSPCREEADSDRNSP